MGLRKRYPVTEGGCVEHEGKKKAGWQNRGLLKNMASYDGGKDKWGSIYQQKSKRGNAHNYTAMAYL